MKLFPVVKQFYTKNVLQMCDNRFRVFTKSLAPFYFTGGILFTQENFPCLHPFTFL